nr:MAG TPA: hypothetical protein [Caudoviricetes sp.]
MEGKLHVEIGIDSQHLVSHLEGNMIELIGAALRCVNLFYAAFERDGDGELFKEIFLQELNLKDSKVWTCGADPAERK